MTPEVTEQLVGARSNEQMVAALARSRSRTQEASKLIVEIPQEPVRRREKARTQILPDAASAWAVSICGQDAPQRPDQSICFECGKDWRDTKQEGFPQPLNRDSETRLALALLAVAPWDKSRRIRIGHTALSGITNSQERSPFRVLQESQPDWIAKWVGNGA